ncbi:YtxH domain-containing protein [Vibrio tubiashii]|uniref:YtxH domain-containing protein n=1 Tax=Vibrio tubiashii TaxID=29498 RepID=UPI00349EDB6B
MSGENTSNNPYEAYYLAMLDAQKQMASAYFRAQQSGEWDPNMPPPWAMGMPPMMPGFCPPPGLGMHGQPTMQPPHWQQAAQFHGPATPPPTNEQHESLDENHPLYQQAQAMLEGALGEEADTFKEILGSFGMSDKEFWKGAMVGAAAALLLSNENVRGKLMGLVSGAGDMLKTGGGAVKDTAVNTASAVKENVSTSSEIFKDTVAAGKQGFQESVEKHKAEPVVKAVEGEHKEPRENVSDEPAIKEQ